MPATVMTKLIRNKASQAFLASDGTWTKDPTRAWHIASSYEAVSARKELKLQNVELYCCCHQEQPSELDFAVPLE